MKNAIKKSVELWFFIAFVAILALDVDNSSTGAVLFVLSNFYASAGVLIRYQQKELREARK